MIFYHTPVLLHEATGYLRVQRGKKYIDATLGGGGHALEIMRLGGIVLGIDFDKEALTYVEKNIKPKVGENLKLAYGNFKEIDSLACLNNFMNISGIIFDLGVSSHQIDTAERGFSFSKSGPLDMRMDKNLNVMASDLINALTKSELYELFSKLGEERNAMLISNSIVEARSKNQIKTTDDLSKLIKEIYTLKNISPKIIAQINMRIFQALRIAVNDELNNLKEGIVNSVKVLDKKARICVISFHSLEDRIVKNQFKDMEKEKIGKIITKKPITPSFQEIRLNRRSRSAKLRVFELN